MANYVIDPEILKPYIPLHTELDDFNGSFYVSLVGFMFNNTRVLGFKIPFHIDFEEVNLRFYVKYLEHGKWKRGTVFIKEIVPKPAISFIANTVYHEKYCTHRMSHYFKELNKEISLGYSWKQGTKWNRLEAITENIPVPMMSGSEEAFIAEHYWGYSKYNETTTFEYNVQHPPWEIFPLKTYLIDCDFTALYGKRFSILQDKDPQSVFVAAGSDVSVLQKRTL